MARWRYARTLRFDDDSLREELDELIGEAEHALTKRWSMSGRKFLILLVIAFFASGVVSPAGDILRLLVFGVLVLGIILLARKPIYAIQAKEVQQLHGSR